MKMPEIQTPSFLQDAEMTVLAESFCRRFSESATLSMVSDDAVRSTPRKIVALTLCNSHAKLSLLLHRLITYTHFDCVL